MHISLTLLPPSDRRTQWFVRLQLQPVLPTYRFSRLGLHRDAPLPLHLELVQHLLVLLCRYYRTYLRINQSLSLWTRYRLGTTYISSAITSSCEIDPMSVKVVLRIVILKSRIYNITLIRSIYLSDFYLALNISLNILQLLIWYVINLLSCHFIALI